MSAQSPPVRIVVADDHLLVRAGFAELLGTRPDVDVVRTASDGAEAVRLCVQLSSASSSWTSACRAWTASKPPGMLVGAVRVSAVGEALLALVLRSLNSIHRDSSPASW
jgi:CheY-like chemotaxis protein